MEQNPGPAPTPAPNMATRVITSDRGHSSGNTTNTLSQSASDNQVCHLCGRRGRLNVNPYICSATGCTEKCHRSCSGISRYKATSEGWVCTTHTTQPGTAVPLRVVPLHPSTLEQGSCHVCGTNFRRGAYRLKCAVGVCNEEYHKGEKCSNIPRYRKNSTWKCSSHSPLVQPLTFEPNCHRQSKGKQLARAAGKR